MTRFERWVEAVANLATATEVADEAARVETEALAALDNCRHVMSDLEDGVSGCIEPDCGYVRVDHKAVTW